MLFRSALSMMAGALFLGVVALASNRVAAPALSFAGWLAVLFLGTFGAAIGFSLWIWALKYSTPTRTAVFLALNPVAATLLGALVLGEHPPTAFYIAFVLVVLGIVFVNARPDAPARLEEKA